MRVAGQALEHQLRQQQLTTLEVLRSSPLADEILESHRHYAHGDDAGYDAYKAHVYRVINFARALTPDSADRDDKLAIAGAFHDLAAFDADDFFNRVVPSGAVRAVRKLQQPGFLRPSNALRRSGHRGADR